MMLIFFKRQVDPRHAKSWKPRLQKALDEVVSAVEPLLHDWLLNPMNEKEAIELREIRNAYLPDVILAYNSILHCAGHLLSRDLLLQCMQLSTIVAAQGSDLAECFVATGRMSELVDSLAASSKALLKANEHGGAKRGKSRKTGGHGESLAIWQVKP